MSSSWIYPVLNVQRLDALKLRVPVCLGAIILLAIKNIENEKNNSVSHYSHQTVNDMKEPQAFALHNACDRDHLLTASSDSPCRVM